MNRSAAAVLLSVILAGCSGLPVQRDYDESEDFGRLKTYSWRAAPREEGGNLADNSLMESRVRRAADAALAAKGFRRVEEGADFHVTYHYLVEKFTGDDRVRTGIGLGMGSGGTFGSLGLGVGSGRREQEVETLALDVKAPSDDRLLWHGFTRRELVRRSDPKKTDKDVKEMVEAVLGKFPPKKK
jgi:hypothetical protein